MNINLSKEALEFGGLARRALEAAGATALVMEAESKPADREAIFAPALAGLGAWQLDPRGDTDDLEAAAALCRAAGYWCVAYPLAERLARPAGLDVDGLLVIDGRRPAAPVAGLGLRWATVTVEGQRGLVSRVQPGEGPRTSAFVASLDVTPLGEAPLPEERAADLALALVLPCWTLLGMLDRAIDLTRAHVLARTQFGRPLSAFQGVQFQLTDAEVERAGVEMLAGYALWSIQAGLPEAVQDALALRLAALEAAEVTFRVAHQLHGAMGFCDESPLSWLSRYSQPARRLPLGLSATRALLAQRVGRRGLAGLFNE